MSKYNSHNGKSSSSLIGIEPQTRMAQHLAQWQASSPLYQLVSAEQESFMAAFQQLSIPAYTTANYYQLLLPYSTASLPPHNGWQMGRC